MGLVLDPAVCRAKFDREIEKYRQLEDDHVRRGWWLVKASYPKIFAVLGAPQLKPPAVIFGVSIDFTDYDFRPPSVRLVDPFTQVPYKVGQIPQSLKRRIPAQSTPGDTGVPAMVIGDFLQHYEGEDPFICLPGIREYHDNPGHSGDNWLLHRGTGAGTLFFILNQIFRYGVEPIAQYALAIQIGGFMQREPPL